MLDEIITELATHLIGHLIGDKVAERHAARTNRFRLVAFNAGLGVVIPCVLRVPDDDHPYWQQGKLGVVPGSATWRRRLRSRNSIQFTRSTALAERARRPARRESRRVGRRDVVLTYRVDDIRLEIAVRRRDVPVVGWVLDMPPFDATGAK